MWDLEDRSVPALFTVNTIADTPDANLQDGLARDQFGFTSLRAAIEQANFSAGADTIQFNLPAGSAILLLIPLQDITTDIGIDGPGAANLTVARAAIAPHTRSR